MVVINWRSRSSLTNTHAKYDLKIINTSGYYNHLHQSRIYLHSCVHAGHPDLAPLK